MSHLMITLSKIGRQVRKLVIISDGKWVSWLHTIQLFLGNAERFESVIILAPSKCCCSYFGLNRNVKVKWWLVDFLLPVSSAMKSKVQGFFNQANLILFHGSAVACKNVWKLLHHSNSLLAVVPGSQRLRHLKPCTTLIWQRVSHASVGGASSDSAWIGFNHGFQTLP